MFYVNPGDDDALNSLTYLTTFLSDRYRAIFGSELLDRVSCRIYNDADADAPTINADDTVIRLSVDSPSYWSNVIFQLSQMMCSYIMRHKDSMVFRFAFVLLSLHYAATHWEECQLSKINSNYASAIEEYLDDYLQEWESEGFPYSQAVELYRSLKEE